jgi:hypothetical protein
VKLNSRAMIRRRSPTYYIDGGIVKQTYPFNGKASDGVYGFDEVVGGGVEEKKEDCESVRSSTSPLSSRIGDQHRQPPIDLLLDDNTNNTTSVIRPSILLSAPARPISPPINKYQSNPQQYQQQQQLIAQHQSHFLTPPSSLPNTRLPNEYVHQLPYDDVFYDIDEKNDDEADDHLRSYIVNRPLDEQIRDNIPAGVGRMMNDESNIPRRGGIGMRVERIAEALFSSCCDGLCSGNGDKEQQQQTTDNGNNGPSQSPLCTSDCLMHPEDWIFRLCTKDDSKYSKAPLSIAEEFRKIGERQRSGGVGSGGAGGGVGGGGSGQHQRPRSPRPTSPGVNRQQQLVHKQQQQQQHQQQQQYQYDQFVQEQAPVYNYRPDIPRYLAEQAVNSFEEDDNISAISQHTIDELTRQGIRHHPRILRRIPTTDDVWATVAEGSGVVSDDNNLGAGSSSTHNMYHHANQQLAQNSSSNSRRPNQTPRGVAKWKQQQQQQQQQMMNPVQSDDEMLFGGVVNHNNNSPSNRGMIHHNYYVPQSVPESQMEDSI